MKKISFLLVPFWIFSLFIFPPLAFAFEYYNPYSSDPYYGQGIYLGQPVDSQPIGPYGSSSYYFDSYNPQYINTPYDTYAPVYCTYFNCATQSISITNLVPSAGSAGTDITVYGYGFSETNNTVHIGNGIVPFLRSSNGTVLSFRVPDTLTGYGTQPLFNQTYDLYVTNASGQNSNKLAFSVTGGTTGYAHTPSVASVSGPSALAAHESGSWSVTVIGRADSTPKVTVVWGDEHQSGASGISEQSIFLGSSGVQTLSFSHTYKQSGTYTPTFIVSNLNGSSSASRTVVVGSGFTAGTVALFSLSPSAGVPGTQVVLSGSGFTALENTVRFGSGGARSIPSLANGTVLYFSIPHYVSPCDTVVGACSVTPVAVTPGPYSVSVTNANGTTQSLTFSVQ